MKDEDKYIDDLLTTAMHDVGERRDRAVIEAIGGMKRDEFQSMLADVVNDVKRERKQSPRIIQFVRRNVIALRAVAACAVLAAVLVGLNYIDFGRNDVNGNATLFSTYYKGDQVDWQKFDAGDDKVNAMGGKSTAAIIEEATGLLESKNPAKVRSGIRQLEHLLTLQYKRSLEHEIHWYLGLGYLKDNRQSKARDEFETVARMKSPHAADAKELVSKLARQRHP